jgi:hypothetical protein
MAGKECMTCIYWSEWQGSVNDGNELSKWSEFLLVGLYAESIEWFTEVQALSRSYDLVPPPLTLPPISRQLAWSATHRKTDKVRQHADGRGERGWARSRIVRPRESLVLCKSSNSLCLHGGCNVLAEIEVYRGIGWFDFQDYLCTVTYIQYSRKIDGTHVCLVPSAVLWL